jgi:hypothetical protein
LNKKKGKLGSEESGVRWRDKKESRGMEGVSRDSTLSYLLLKALHEDRSVTVYWMK